MEGSVETQSCQSCQCHPNSSHPMANARLASIGRFRPAQPVRLSSSVHGHVATVGNPHSRGVLYTHTHLDVSMRRSMTTQTFERLFNGKETAHTHNLLPVITPKSVPAPRRSLQ